jgi:hypothetical protein
MIVRKKYQLVALAVTAVAAITAFLLVSPLTSGGSHGDAAILEEGGNINLALREAQKGIGPSIVGDPTAIYGKITTYSGALKAAGVGVVFGESEVWKLDRPVHLYLFEGDITDADPRSSNISDWAQKVVILDAATGNPFLEATHRAVTRLDVSQFLPLSIRDYTRGVPPREIKRFNLPLTIPAAPATPAPRAP